MSREANPHQNSRDRVARRILWLAALRQYTFAPTMQPSLGASLEGRYNIVRELGAGGMATVYLADDVRHRRKVALKVLKPELAAVLGADRFVQEITTTAALQHPHILPLFDSGTAGGFLYYVMPFIDGETLRERLNRETQLGIGEAVKITVAVADALDYAHRHGVVHRDIKPAFRYEANGNAEAALTVSRDGHRVPTAGREQRRDCVHAELRDRAGNEAPVASRQAASAFVGVLAHDCYFDDTRRNRVRRLVREAV